jgi:hypothetical protein
MRFSALSLRYLAVLAATAVGTAVLIPVAATAAMASPAAAASAARTSASAVGIPAISVNSATLVADGAAVRVVFTATCGAGDSGIFSSTITQAAGDRVAQGGNQFVGFNCTGKPQQLSYLFAANVNGAPFHLGVAVVQANISDCPGANCTGASTDKVLRIKG